MPLRLTVTRGVLGLELYRATSLGPLEVATLSVTLPGLRFPLDLSGGVRRFRNRRGDLERLVLRIRFTELARWLAGRFAPDTTALGSWIRVWGDASSLGIGVMLERGALAFDLLWAPSDGDARFVVANPRAVGPTGPALSLALKLIDTAFAGAAERRGRVVTLVGLADRVCRVLMPAIGARSPATARVRLASDFSVQTDEVLLSMDSAFAPPAPSRGALRALELAQLCMAPDDDLARGELERAREGYLFALEQAPRHPHIVGLIAEIDHSVGGRDEAALGMVAETMPPVEAGLLGARLLSATGQLEAAREALSIAVHNEPYAPLASLVYLNLAEIDSEAPTRLWALDEAVARCPSLSAARWARFETRLRRCDVEGALADALHLEAATTGAAARHDVCRRAARQLLDEGFVKHAGTLFERALRYAPDDAGSTAGLARAFMELGRVERAVSLLNRAIYLSERSGQQDADALLDLAQLLAEKIHDLPQAIARVRQVPSSAPRAIEARALEGRWRATLGDIAGASLAFARLRDAVQLAHEPRVISVALLTEAARFERQVQKDPVAAERHLAVALRVAPHDRALGAEYREVAAEVATRLRSTS